MSKYSAATNLNSFRATAQLEKLDVDAIFVEYWQKNIECITVNNTEPRIITYTKKVCMQFCYNTLMIEEKDSKMIENNLELTNSQVDFTNCLISCEFPHISGL